MNKCAVILNGSDVVKVTNLKRKYNKFVNNPDIKILEECDEDQLENIYSYWCLKYSSKKEEPADLPSFAPDQLASIMSVMSALNKSGDDARTRLLLALKPHLSEKRRERVDRAIKLMKLISIMPLITESGLFKL